MMTGGPQLASEQLEVRGMDPQGQGKGGAGPRLAESVVMTNFLRRLTTMPSCCVSLATRFLSTRRPFLRSAR
jgi:hypothetical protein